MKVFNKLILVASFLVVSTSIEEPQQTKELTTDPMTMSIPEGTQLAGRYYLRNRTNRFYQRAGRGYSRTAIG